MLVSLKNTQNTRSFYETCLLCQTLFKDTFLNRHIKIKVISDLEKKQKKNRLYSQKWSFVTPQHHHKHHLSWWPWWSPLLSHRRDLWKFSLWVCTWLVNLLFDGSEILAASRFVELSQRRCRRFFHHVFIIRVAIVNQDEYGSGWVVESLQDQSEVGVPHTEGWMGLWELWRVNLQQCSQLDLNSTLLV